MQTLPNVLFDRNRRLLASLCLVSLAAPGCTVEGEGSFAPSAAKQDSATGNRYLLPDPIEDLGDIYHVPYVGAGLWNGSGSCTGDMTPGARAVRDFLLKRYEAISSIGGYACRHIVGNEHKASVHSTGRALDIMLPVGFRAEANNHEGDPIANFLIANAEDLGLQFLIWDRTSWGAHRTPGQKERYYSGQHPHNDHIHIELSEASGRGEAAWLQDDWVPIEPSFDEEGEIILEGEQKNDDEPDHPEEEPTEELPPVTEEEPPEPTEDPREEPAPEPPSRLETSVEEPEPSPCQPLPPEGGILDRDTNCLWLRGPKEHWNLEDTGHGNGLAWTTALQSGSHLNSAKWRVRPERAGNYEIHVYLEPEYATAPNIRYTIRHGDTESEVLVDQSQGKGWTSIGTFSFNKGDDQHVTVFDNTDKAVAGEQRLMVDALRLTFAQSEEGAEQGEKPVPEKPGKDEPEGKPGPDTGEQEEPKEGSEQRPNGPSDPDSEQTDPAKDTPATPNGPRVVSGCQQAPGTSLLSLLLLFGLSYMSTRLRRGKCQENE